MPESGAHRQGHVWGNADATGAAHSITLSITAAISGDYVRGDTLTYSDVGRYVLVTRQLLALGENISISEESQRDIETSMTLSDKELAATAADSGKYTITKDSNGITITYVTATLPEPTTAVLMALGLCCLAQRRRR